MWRYFWQFHRDVLTDQRARLRAVREARTNPSADVRADALATLRDGFASGPMPVRVAAAIALGRVGRPEDAIRLATVVRKGEPDLTQACCLGLGLFPPLPAEIEEQVGNALLESRSAHGWFAIGLRPARAQVTAALARPAPRERLPEQLFAAGQLRAALILPELKTAALKSRFFVTPLADLERGYGTQALGRFGRARALASLAVSRTAGPDTRRAAAFGLYEMAGQPADARALHIALMRVLGSKRDNHVRAFAALGIGRLGTNPGLIALMKRLDSREDRALKPVYALALGLGAKARPDWKQLRSYLVGRLRDVRTGELRIALEVAVGLARIERGVESLLESLEHERASEGRRSWAARSLGYLGLKSDRVVRALRKGVEQGGTGPLGENAALALGLLGERSIVPDVRDALFATKEARGRARFAYLLGLLEGDVALQALTRVAENPAENDRVRGMAVVALGMALDARNVDPLARLKTRLLYLSATPTVYEALLVH